MGALIQQHRDGVARRLAGPQASEPCVHKLFAVPGITARLGRACFAGRAARNGLGRAADAVRHHGAHHIQHLGRRLAAAHAALHGGVQALRDAFAVFIHNGLCEGGRDIGAAVGKDAGERGYLHRRGREGALAEAEVGKLAPVLQKLGAG